MLQGITIQQYAKNVGVLQHKVNRAYVCKNHIVQLQHHIVALKQRETQAEYLCNIYKDRVKAFAPDWVARNLAVLAGGDAGGDIAAITHGDLQRLIRYINTHYQEIHQCGKLERLAQEIREFEIEKHHCLCDLQDLHKDVTDLLEKTTPVAQALGIDGTLEDYRKCIPNTIGVLEPESDGGVGVVCPVPASA